MAAFNDCGYPLPIKFVELLANALMKTANNEVFVNLKLLSVQNCECTPLIDCNNNHIDYEDQLVQAFESDDCDHVALKVGFCDSLGIPT
jgi:hypothetical protein